MAMEIQEKDSRFRVKWQGFSIDWFPDIPSNRKGILVFLRSLKDSRGKRMFTFQELSALFDSNSRMVLYYYGVPLSELGNWLKVHKTTVLRWMIGLSLELFPIVYRWIYDNVIDEKWLKIRGKWHYWFVVLDSDTGLPVLASLLGTRSQWACRWIGVKLKQMGKIPREVITDGMSGYRSMVEDVLEKARHNLCHFHHQQRVTVWLKKRFQDKEQIAARKSKMKKVFQTDDKRTVRSRLGKKSWAYQNGHSGLKKSASCPINFALTICATLNSITWGILISDLRFSIEPD